MTGRDLDFIDAPKRPSGRLLIVLGLGLMIAAVLNYRHQSATLLEMENTVQARQDSLPKTAKPADADDAAIEAARLSLSRNWEPLLQAVEAASKPNVALLTLEPDAGRGTVRLVLEAKDNDAMLAYVEGLASQPGMHGVDLLDQETQVEHPQQPVRFTVGASWQ